MKFKYLIIGIFIALIGTIEYLFFDSVLSSVILILSMIIALFFISLEYIEYSKGSNITKTVLCYILKDDKVLLIKKAYKENDMNSNKYMGVGGHIEENESIDDAILREVKEETNLTLTSYNLLGEVKFYMNNEYKEKIYVYLGYDVKGEIKASDEGELEFVKKDEIYVMVTSIFLPLPIINSSIELSITSLSST